MRSQTVLKMDNTLKSVDKQRKILHLIHETGYNLMQVNGQRVYGPPPDWPQCAPPPPKGCEVFIGRLPRDCFEDELVPVFSIVGKIYSLRLMIDFDGGNRGFAFITYCNAIDADKAVQTLNGIQIRNRHNIGVVKAIENNRLFVSNIPDDKTAEDVKWELKRRTPGVVTVNIFERKHNDRFQCNTRYAVVEYESHKCAAIARRQLRVEQQLCGITVKTDWANKK